jgi:hypothetical protein
MNPGASSTAAVNEPRLVPGAVLQRTREVARTLSYPQTRRLDQQQIGGSVLNEKPGSIMGGNQQVKCTRGFGTSAASRAMKSSGSNMTWVVPSRYGVLSV